MVRFVFKFKAASDLGTAVSHRYCTPSGIQKFVFWAWDLGFRDA